MSHPMLIHVCHAATVTICCSFKCVTSIPPHLLLQLDHDIRNLDVLLGLVLSRNLKDGILLVLRHRLLADELDDFSHTALN
jgi:hypothetical protein